MNDLHHYRWVLEAHDPPTSRTQRRYITDVFVRTSQPAYLAALITTLALAIQKSWRFYYKSDHPTHRIEWTITRERKP